LNGEHLAFVASLILDHDRSSLELRSEIEIAIHEFSDAQFRILFIDRVALFRLSVKLCLRFYL